MSWREEISEDVLALISLIASLYSQLSVAWVRPASQNTGRSWPYSGLEEIQLITFQKAKQAGVAIQSHWNIK